MSDFEATDRYTRISRELGPVAFAKIRPTAAHDDLTFDELAGRYNFSLTTLEPAVFTRLLIRECERIERECGRPARVLDIGCGRGIARVAEFTQAIRLWAGEFWGLEPDTGKTALSGLFDRFAHRPIEGADLPEGYFDLAYSAMVMEHVDRPEAYLAAVARCLRPGGVHMFITPNKRHYFARIANTMRVLRVDEALLRVLLPDEVDDDHYPIRYRCNDARTIDRLGRQTGFFPSRFAYLEWKGPRPYMRGPLVLGYHALREKRRRLKHPEALLMLVARMERNA